MRQGADKHRISLLMGDREFMGHTWPKDTSLNFVMLPPKHHLLGGQVWFNALEGNEFLFLFGNVGGDYMDQFCAKRWTIEQCFQHLKGCDFNLEASHLRCHQELRKLVALVSLAYALCLRLGRGGECENQTHCPQKPRLPGHQPESV